MILPWQKIRSEVNSYGGWGTNDNEILFLCAAFLEFKLAYPNEWEKRKEEALEWFNTFMKATHVKAHHYKRSPRDYRINSHDNYTGIALGYLLLETPKLKKEASLFYVNLNLKGFSFNNEDPSKYDIRGQLTPKDTIWISLAANLAPTALQTLYTAFHLFFGRSWNLNRLRINMLMFGMKKGHIKGWKRFVFKHVIKKAISRVDFTKAISDYFGPDSPITECIQYSKGRWFLDPESL